MFNILFFLHYYLYCERIHVRVLKTIGTNSFNDNNNNNNAILYIWKNLIIILNYALGYH